MEYKGYNISEVEALLLLDILQVQQEILAELKKLNELKSDITDMDPCEQQEKINELLQDEESIGLTEEVQEAIEEPVQEVKEVKKQTQKKPAKRKPAKKKAKAKSKKATK